MKIKEFQKLLMDSALKNGFQDCEVYFEHGKTFQSVIYEGEIAQYENSTQRGVSFRGSYDGKMGYAYSEEISENAINFIVNKAKENASVIEDYDKEELYFSDNDYTDLNIFNNELANVSDLKKIEFAKEAEMYAKNTDKRIDTVDNCIIAYEESEVSIVNSRGMNVSYKTNAVMAYVCAIAKQGKSIKTGSEYFLARDLNNFSPKQLGTTASLNAISHLEASTVSSGHYMAMFAQEPMNDILSVFAGVFFAENVQKGFSLLNGKIGKKIASDILTIYDNGLLDKAMGTVPFDSEGVKSINKTIIENGVLKTFLYNLKSAKKDGVKSTGNGFKAGFKSPVMTNITNFYIQKGNFSCHELLEKIHQGILITEIAGLHSGANTVSGDFSFSAEGFLIEDGIISKPIEQITVAGNFYDFIKDIKYLGNNLKFSMSGRIGSPYVVVGDISVSGE